MEQLASIRNWLNAVAYKQIPKDYENHLRSLPIDILVQIVSHLELTDVISISLTCCDMQTKIRHMSVWNVLFKNDFPNEYIKTSTGIHSVCLN